MTENNTEHTETRRRTRWPWFLLAGLVLLMAGLRLSLKTDLVRGIVKNQVISAANDQLTVELSINSLEGDLWKEIVLQGITISDEQSDTVGRIDSLRLRYNLMSYFRPVFEVPEISISGPFIKVRQQEGRLNLAEWVKAEPVDTAASESEPFPIQIERIQVNRGSIDAIIEAMPKDSAFTVDNLHFAGSFTLLEDSYEATVSEFSFDIFGTELSDKVSFESRLSADKQTVSLEKLVLATGSSLIQSSGKFQVQDSAASLDLQAQPLSWKDIAAYADQSPVEQNLGLDVQLKGSLSEFSVGLGIRSEGIDELQVSASFKRDTAFTLTGAKIRANRLNLQDFFNDPAMPNIQNLRFESDGIIPLTSYQKGSVKGSLYTGRIVYEAYTLDTLKTDFSLDKGKTRVVLNTGHQKQRLTAEADISDLWIPDPKVDYTVQASNINPGYWLRDNQFNGRITFNGRLNGTGLSLDNSSWEYRLNMEKGRISRQEFNKVSLSGKINSGRITNKSLLRLQKSQLTLNATVRDYLETPDYTYDLRTRNLNLSDIIEIEEFDTDINLDIKGEGSGLNLAELRMEAILNVDSSVINNERIQRLHANLRLQDSIATITDAGLQSSIAEGSFTAQLHLMDWYDPGNEMSLDLLLKDLQSLAPLAGAETLQAEGSVSGKLAPAPNRTGDLNFTGTVDVNNLSFDEIFSANRAAGRVDLQVKENPEYIVDLELFSPVFSSVQLEDLKLAAEGNFAEDIAEGFFMLNITGPEESAINHEGRYRYTADSTEITTNKLEVKSSQSTLSLQSPFGVRVVGQAVRTDTLLLTSGDGAMLELAVPYADSLRQSGYLQGRNIDMSVMQNTLLGESYFDGMLTGNLSVANTDTSLQASGKISLSQVNYRGSSFDSLNVDLDLAEMQLKSRISVRDQGNELLSGHLNVPFRLGDPLQFEEAFFENRVDGSLRIKRLALNRFENLMNEMGLTETEGILRLQADLGGTAGTPEFRSKLTLDSAMVSGVAVDSITADLRYLHQKSSLAMDATVNSLKQKVADIDARVPFLLDMKQGTVSLPGEQDSIYVHLVTNDFNLAALNDFVDREMIRDIKGKLNGEVRVTGTPADLVTGGKLTVTESSMRIVETGITIDGIRAGIAFKPDLITLTDFTARSGTGNLNMNGSIAFKELIPGDVNLSLRARNFKVANTSEYNAAIDLNTKVTGSFKRPEISGNLAVLSGFVQLDNFGEKSVEDVQLDSTEQTDFSIAMYDSLALDMDISFNRRFFIRNQRYLEMEVELDGSVDMLKEAGGDLQMFGSLEAVNGYARPLGKRFELEEGIVTFSGDPTNPNLNIRTIFEPPQPEEEVKIWYIIEGSVEDPQFKYESSPPMELEDILCYTLFGQPCFALESWKQAVASTGSNTGATGLALELFSDRIETLAAQSLGIDVVKIENTTIGGEAGTSITTGWYINPKVFFAIQNVISGSSPDTSFLLEYMLLENLKLIISQGNDARQGVDIKWNYDY